MIETGVGPEPIDVAALARRVSSSSNGAITTFVGTVRDMADGRPVVGLEYSAYLEMAHLELARIAAEAVALAPGVSVAARHRTGPLSVGDVSVAIAVGHPHRAPTFEACRYVIEEIKRRVPVWKQEHYADGSREWVTPAESAAAPGD